MAGREPELAPRGAALQRLPQAHLETLRIATGGEGASRRPAHRSCSVRAQELQPLPRQAVERRRAIVGTTIAAQVAVSEIVGEDEEHVGRPPRRRTPAGGYGRGGAHGGADELASGDPP